MGKVTHAKEIFLPLFVTRKWGSRAEKVKLRRVLEILFECSHDKTDKFIPTVWKQLAESKKQKQHKRNLPRVCKKKKKNFSDFSEVEKVTMG